MHLLEVCVDSLASARAAISGGADRLELCGALSVGGLTPYAQLLHQIRQESHIPVRCLMRPRAGDFFYTSDEILLMAAQIRDLKAVGADGFVIGCLTADGDLDCAAMEPLIQAADGAGLTLHRCIDVSRDLEATYLAAASLGIDTVLTSGGASNCISGMSQIRRLIQLRDEQNGPEILIGAGVKASVMHRFLTEVPGAQAFHMSGKIEIDSKMRFRRAGIPMGLPGLDEWHIQQTSAEMVASARTMLLNHL